MLERTTKIPKLRIPFEVEEPIYAPITVDKTIVDGLDEADPLALFVPDPDSGTVSDRTGNQDGVLSGADVTGDEIADAVPGAISCNEQDDQFRTDLDPFQNASPMTLVVVVRRGSTATDDVIFTSRQE